MRQLVYDVQRIFVGLALGNRDRGGSHQMYPFRFFVSGLLKRLMNFLAAQLRWKNLSGVSSVKASICSIVLFEKLTQRPCKRLFAFVKCSANTDPSILLYDTCQDFELFF